MTRTADEDTIRDFIRDFSTVWGPYSLLIFFPSVLKALRTRSGGESIGAILARSFGGDSVRFGGFVSVYFLCYRRLNKLLRSQHPKLDDGKRAMISGSLSALSCCVLDKTTRFNLAVYASVRALYSAWSRYTKDFDFARKYGPTGRLIGLMLTSAQLCYYLFIIPEAMDVPYRKFVESLSALTHDQIAQMRFRAVNGQLDPKGVLELIEYHKTGGTYDPSMNDILANPTNSISCLFTHPGETCASFLPHMGLKLFPRVFPLYLAISLVPRILFAPHKFLTSPMKPIASALRSALRTTSFIVTYSVINRTYLCLKTNLGFPDIPAQYWIMGLIGGTSFAIESPSRQVEWLLYYMGKIIFGIEKIMAKKGSAIGRPHLSLLAFAASMAIIMRAHLESQDELVPMVRGILNFFLKKK